MCHANSSRRKRISLYSESSWKWNTFEILKHLERVSIVRVPSKEENWLMMIISVENVFWNRSIDKNRLFNQSIFQNFTKYPSIWNWKNKWSGLELYWNWLRLRQSPINLFPIFAFSSIASATTHHSIHHYK